MVTALILCKGAGWLGSFFEQPEPRFHHLKCSINTQKEYWAELIYLWHSHFFLIYRPQGTTSEAILTGSQAYPSLIITLTCHLPHIETGKNTVQSSLENGQLKPTDSLSYMACSPSLNLWCLSCRANPALIMSTFTELATQEHSLGTPSARMVKTLKALPKGRLTRKKKMSGPIKNIILIIIFSSSDINWFLKLCKLNNTFFLKIIYVFLTFILFCFNSAEQVVWIY